jgi:hypothetical protein
MQQSSEPIGSPTVSRTLADGRLIELVLDRESARTSLAVWDGTQCQIVDKVAVSASEHLVPVPASNNLIRHNAVVLPEKPAPYADVEQLASEIEAYFGRYVVVSEEFRKLAAYYVLFTWVYDAFDEVPYLRVQAEWGSGKTRALIIIGSICYRGFFASGASTVSPIFHTLDTFRGTLVLDEADFRFSDQTAELVKILNNGNVQGFPVFRTAITQKREFDPRAFQVFGPKLIAMRKSFQDDALESRFITERMDRQHMHAGIPINLPKRQREEACALRNKLLQYRFDHRMTVRADESLADARLLPRTNQILIPLLSIVPNSEARATIKRVLFSLEAERTAFRSTSLAADVLTLLSEFVSERPGMSIPVADVAERFATRFAKQYERPITHRLIGSIVRSTLGLKTYKSGGVFKFTADKELLASLSKRYGLVPEVEVPQSEQGVDVGM